MTSSLGPIIPRNLQERFALDPSANSHRVIIFSTVDDSGFPHYGMISYYQIASRKNSNFNLILSSQSKTSKNLERNNRITLLFVDEEMSYYVKCHSKSLGQCISDATNQTVFELSVSDVLADSTPSAKISSGITFTGMELGLTAERRDKIYYELKRAAT
jgi:Pyridoxamine 5'-phosphate oxidase